MTTISIVVPAYSCRPWIAELLESIRAQTYPRDRLETIVIADGSGDASAAIARSFLVRHAMQGTVLVGERAAGIGAAMNVGWRAATGEWVQFVSGRDVLAPNKIEEQAKHVPQLADHVSAIFSSWQLLGLAGDQWLLAGPVHRPEFADPIVLKLLARPPVRLGAGLIRKKAIAAVAGFSEDVAFTLEEHFLVKIAGFGMGRTSTRSPLATFVEAPSTRPLFFERQDAEGPSRYGRVGSARQHLENVLFARAILQQHGLLTAANGDALAALCNEGLRELNACDAAASRRCARRLREIDPRLVSPEAPRKYVQVLGSIGGGVLSLTRTTSRGTRLVRHWLQRGRGRYRLNGIALSGIAKTLASLLWSSRIPLRGAMTAAALLGGILALGALVHHGGLVGLPGAAERSEQRKGTPTIVVASTIYAEPSSRWPMPIEVGPAQSVSPDSKLLIRGLPPGATLSDGRRTPGGAWVVPVAGLASLEVQVPAGAAGRVDLTLALVGTDDGSLAEAHTALSFNEPTLVTPGAPATAARPLEPPTVVALPTPMIAATPAESTPPPIVGARVALAQPVEPPTASAPAAVEAGAHGRTVAEAVRRDPPQNAAMGSGRGPATRVARRYPSEASVGAAIARD